MSDSAAAPPPAPPQEPPPQEPPPQTPLPTPQEQPAPVVVSAEKEKEIEKPAPQPAQEPQSEPEPSPLPSPQQLQREPPRQTDTPVGVDTPAATHTEMKSLPGSPASPVSALSSGLKSPRRSITLRVTFAPEPTVIPMTPPPSSEDESDGGAAGGSSTSPHKIETLETTSLLGRTASIGAVPRFEKPGDTQGTLSWIQIAAIVYFSVGGGPFGFEEGLTASTPAVCLTALTLMALLWALPQALFIAELATRFDLGYNQWIVSSIGTTAAMAHNLIRVAFGVLTNGVYADLFSTYFSKVLSPSLLEFGSSSSSLPVESGDRLFAFSWQKILGLALFEATVVGINLGGMKIVGKASVALLFLVLSPFLVMACWAFPRLDWRLLGTFPSSREEFRRDVDLSLLVSILMFNLMGWDFVGNLSSRAKKPHRDVPVGIGVALVLVFLTFAVPTFTASSILGVAAAKHSKNLFIQAAAALWRPFGYILSAAALMGVFGLGCAFMSTSSEAFAHSVHYRFLPMVVRNRLPKAGTVWIPILFQGALSFFLCFVFEFTHLVQIQMWLFCLSTLTIAVAFVVIRWRERKSTIPLPPRMFRLKLSFWPAALLALATVALSIFGLVVTSWYYIVVGVSILLLSVAASFAWTHNRTMNNNHLVGEKQITSFISVSTGSLVITTLSLTPSDTIVQ